MNVRLPVRGSCTLQSGHIRWPFKARDHTFGTFWRFMTDPCLTLCLIEAFPPHCEIYTTTDDNRPRMHTIYVSTGHAVPRSALQNRHTSFTSSHEPFGSFTVLPRNPPPAAAQPMCFGDSLNPTPEDPATCVTFRTILSCAALSCTQIEDVPSFASSQYELTASGALCNHIQTLRIPHPVLSSSLSLAPWDRLQTLCCSTYMHRRVCVDFYILTQW